jgi:hypothetical protein
MQIKKAERLNKKMRLGLFGPSGSGKTFSALKVAKGLADGNMEKVVVIDTENDSATDYSDIFPGYSVLNMEPPYEPQRYVNAISACEDAGFEVIIIDSITHVWFGQGGCLEMVDKYQNKFGGWKDVTPAYNKFVDKTRHSKAHVIACGRAKQEHALQEGNNGKKEVVKLGMGVQIREGFEYELTVGLELFMNHHAVAGGLGKDRTNIFAEKPPQILSEDHGRALLQWCQSGREVSPEEAEVAQVESLQHQIRLAAKQKGIVNLDDFQRLSGIDSTNGKTVAELQEALGRINRVEVA